MSGDIKAQRLLFVREQLPMVPFPEVGDFPALFPGGTLSRYPQTIQEADLGAGAGLSHPLTGI